MSTQNLAKKGIKKTGVIRRTRAQRRQLSHLTAQELSTQLLKPLQGALRSVDFGAGLRAIDTFSWQNDKQFIEDQSDSSLAIKWMAAELFDYAGRYGDAQHILSWAFGSEQRLKRAAGQSQFFTIEQRSSYKQHVLTVVQRGFVFYRGNGPDDLDKAAETWELCRRFVQNCLSTEDYPCYGTLSRIFYGIGLVYRQRHRYAEAKRAFGQAIEYAQRDADRHRRLDPRAAALPDYRFAKCYALGLGWVAYTQGAPDSAQSFIHGARRFLSDKKVPIIKAYVDVVYACAEMARFEEQEEQQLARLERCIHTLNNAYKLFEDQGHAAYRVRTANELGLAYLRRARLCPDRRDQNLAAAEKHASEVKDYLGGSNRRWYCNALIITSRISRERGKYAEAAAIATDALNLAQSDLFVEIEALIARGEALLAQEQRTLEAIEQFKEALEKGQENPKTKAVCHLHLTRCYVRIGDVNRALNHLEKWQILSRIVENAFVRRLAQQVRREIAAVLGERDFRVPADLPLDELTARVLRILLDAWLVARVRDQLGPTASKTNVANQLGRAPGTIDNWVKAFQDFQREFQDPEKADRIRPLLGLILSIVPERNTGSDQASID